MNVDMVNLSMFGVGVQHFRSHILFIIVATYKYFFFSAITKTTIQLASRWQKDLTLPSAHMYDVGLMFSGLASPCFRAVCSGGLLDLWADRRLHV